eukprot:COSAG01_NODE_6171_length_3810_cov_25.586476_2_plen_89_part_00
MKCHAQAQLDLARMQHQHQLGGGAWSRSAIGVSSGMATTTCKWRYTTMRLMGERLRDHMSARMQTHVHTYTHTHTPPPHIMRDLKEPD